MNISIVIVFIVNKCIRGETKGFIYYLHHLRSHKYTTNLNYIDQITTTGKYIHIHINQEYVYVY